MIDYSKLSDAEIAEKVFQGLDLTANEICRDWVIGEILWRDDERTPEFLCFDWPAPLMMAKVEERLGEGRHTYRMFNAHCGNHYDELELAKGNMIEVPAREEFQYTIWIDNQSEDLDGDIHGRSDSKPRALYEAFLQVCAEVKV